MIGVLSGWKSQINMVHCNIKQVIERETGGKETKIVCMEVGEGVTPLSLG